MVCRIGQVVVDYRCGSPWCGRIASSHFMLRRFQVSFECPVTRPKFYDPNSRSEKLGAAMLADDDAAVAFAQRVMRELLHSDKTLYGTWIVNITAKECTLASILASDATAA
jgi:hypothetical protein